MAKRSIAKWVALVVVLWFVWRRVKMAMAGPALDAGLPATTINPTTGGPVVYLSPKHSYELATEPGYISPYFKYSELNLTPEDVKLEPTRTLALRLAYRLTLARTGAFKGPVQVLGVIKRNGYWAARVKRAPSAPSSTDPVATWAAAVAADTIGQADAFDVVDDGSGAWVVGPVGVRADG